jgi:hypothetical protein
MWVCMYYLETWLCVVRTVNRVVCSCSTSILWILCRMGACFVEAKSDSELMGMPEANRHVSSTNEIVSLYKHSRLETCLH